MEILCQVKLSGENLILPVKFLNNDVLYYLNEVKKWYEQNISKRFYLFVLKLSADSNCK